MAEQTEQTPATTERPRWIELPGLVAHARLEVHCHLCLERDGKEHVIEAELEHPDPADPDEGKTWYRVRCPRCSDAYGMDAFVVIQLVSASQLEDDGEPDETETEVG